MELIVGYIYLFIRNSDGNQNMRSKKKFYSQ